MTAAEVIEAIKKQANPEKATILRRFFKTRVGEYGEGDQFLGIVVPKIRLVVKQFRTLPLREIIILIKSPIHEIRLCGLLILVEYSKTNPVEAAKTYLDLTLYINNWDLVDLTADKVIGPTLDPSNLALLVDLAHSKSLWERRIAIMSTFYFIKQGNPEPTLQIAPLLLHDSHDLIHKAVGWMLREVGKRCNLKAETGFLDKQALEMPRTMLRYAIERFPEPLRQSYLKRVK
jgi:3-methyladenine DNA glycosylase AlkD